MAGSINKVILVGRFGADPELKYLPSGQPVVNVNMATDDSYKDRQSGQKVERTEWHRLVVYGKAAEIVANYTRKGSLLYIEGSLRTRKWQGQDGQDRYTTEVIVKDFTFLDSRQNQDGYGQQGYGNQQNYGGQQNSGGGYGNQRGPQQGPPPQQQQGGPQGQQGGRQGGYQMEDDVDMGPAFPSEAGGMDDVPF